MKESVQSIEINPLFFSSVSGNIFLTHFKKNDVFANAVFIFCPPVGDEMNKSRRMLAQMAKRFVNHQYDVVLPDYYGTGDSEGDFADAKWECWIDDIHEIVRWCQNKGYAQINFLALRSGALLLAGFLAQNKISVHDIVLWQPTTSGDLWLTQFLRLKFASGLLSSDEPKTTTKSLKEQLIQGQNIEVAGYMLSPELVLPLAKVKLAELNTGNVERIAWIELVAHADKGLLPISKKVIDQINTSSKVVSNTVVGLAFWNTVEIVDVDALLSGTLNYLVINRGC